MNLGRYEVVRELGKGAMGIVYLAKDPVIGRLVALKTIRVGASTDEDEAHEFQQRFVREAQAAGILSHPSIVTVHDIGEDSASGVSFIAMEFVDGRNLKEVLQAGEHLGFARIADVIAQVAEALDYSHSRGIVHRDVKPANIILCSEQLAKITDFGIAKIASTVSNLTNTGQFLGTPNYMAPEQVKGLPVDGRTDLFSLGIVLYECLTRKKPFGGDSLTTISYKIVHEPFPPLRQVDPAIPAAFEPIVERCLSKDPSRRYQRGNELAADLRAAVAKEGAPTLTNTVLASEPPRPRRAGDSGSRIRPPTAAQPASSDSSGLVAEATNALRRVSTSLGPALSPRRQISPLLFWGVVVALFAALSISAFIIQRNFVEVPVVDEELEARVRHQRALRIQANEMIRRGNVEGAYAKYRELLAVAPTSRHAAEYVAKLDRARAATKMTRQQWLDRANRSLAEGKRVYDRGHYAVAIPFFEVALSINPDLEEAMQLLRASRQAVAKNARPAPVVSTISLADGSQAPAPAALVTELESSVNDGYVTVSIGDRLVVNEMLWEDDRDRAVRRRLPRRVYAYAEVPAGPSELEVTLAVPGMNYRETRVLKRDLKAGTLHRLRLSFDRDSRAFGINLQ